MYHERGEGPIIVLGVDIIEHMQRRGIYDSLIDFIIAVGVGVRGTFTRALRSTPL